MPKREGQSNNEVIVADSARFRLLQVNLDADFLQGTSSLADSSWQRSHHVNRKVRCMRCWRQFTHSLPRFADNIRLDIPQTSTESYYVIGLGTPSKKHFSLLWLLYQTPVDSWPYWEVRSHEVCGEVSPEVWFAERHLIPGNLWLGSHNEPRLVLVPHEKLPGRWEG